MDYFGISEYYRPVPGLDQWLRRRVRMWYWKRWRKARTKIRNLLKLGTNKDHAIQTGRSSKAYWRLARTLATHSGRTNDWLKSPPDIPPRPVAAGSWIRMTNRGFHQWEPPSAEPPGHAGMLGGVGRAGSNPAFTRFEGNLPVHRNVRSHHHRHHRRRHLTNSLGNCACQIHARWHRQLVYARLSTRQYNQICGKVI